MKSAIYSLIIAFLILLSACGDPQKNLNIDFAAIIKPTDSKLP